MAFLNRVRLPIKLTKPQFPSEEERFRKADGSFKTTSAIVRKTYEGETDWMPEKWHERLAIALTHDTVVIEGDKYLGGISKDGAYDIDWQGFLDYPTAPAKFKVHVNPFLASNSNCMTCEQAAQVELTDDTFEDAYGDPLDLEEDTTYNLNVLDNDTVCCSPATYSIISFNTTYLDSATILNGVLTIHTKTGLTSANGILLAAYRVTCPNGGYDEAGVYGNISGVVEGCLAPVNLEVTSYTTTGATLAWEAPSPAPADGYIWELYDLAAPGSPVDSGTEAGLGKSFIDLDPGINYRFYVKSDCGVTESNFISVDFSTPVQAETCGHYRLTYSDPDGIAHNYTDVTYLDCASDYDTFRVYHGHPREVCALENSPGDPVSIVSSAVDALTIEYLFQC